MSEPTSTSGLEGPARDAGGALGPELIEEVLADFRTWLREAAIPPPPAAPTEPPDWSSILQQWVALRQEVNLQTRASRAQLEQNAKALEELARTVDTLEDQGPTDDSAGDESLRPLLKALVDVHEALTLGHREAQRLTAALATPLPAISFPWWGRWLGVQHRVVQPVQDAWQKLAEAQRQKVDALLVGYQMGLQRLDRVLQQQGLQPIDVVGQPFDPEQMEVVEVVRELGREGSIVLDEVRRGYLWNGRVFRFAQVRVARP
jgi:molecular chaperone GrpE